MKRCVIPLRLRSLAGGDAGRKVTWLELFFDLIFVAAVSQVTGPLREQYLSGRPGAIRAALSADLVRLGWPHRLFDAL